MQCLLLQIIGKHLTKKLGTVLLAVVLFSSHAIAQQTWYSIKDKTKGGSKNPAIQLEDYPIDNNTEQQLPPNKVFLLWTQDETYFRPQEDDKIEVKTELKKQLNTIKLKNAVPAIGFKSGKADIPQALVEKLRVLLREMKQRKNVRLHFIGHSDTDKLGAALQVKFIDNVGLSRHRSQTAAEFFLRALNLSPDSVSFDGVGAARPIASNNTVAGKRKNRRVEVQVWYDEEGDKLVEKKIRVAPEKLNRIKVCRQETVCKLSYKNGTAKRTKLKNLVNPLRIASGQAGVPKEFLRQIQDAIKNLQNKRHLVLRFVGFTDNQPLTSAEKRIYSNHLNLSKARARYVALEVQSRLQLGNDAISSSGKGLKFPIASNGTARGRQFNRRVEVEFWYDDPFDNVSDEPQICADASGSETVVLNYDPPNDPIKPIYFKDGKPIIPAGFSQLLAQVLKGLKDKTNARLNFVGYTNNERLERRTARVYGDDVGLSLARAKRVMEIVKKEVGLSNKQVEFEGHGYVHSDDVVSSGFMQFDGSRVDVKIIYDELALIDDLENIKVEKIDREALVKNPYALNLMRITVDGKPLYDPSKHTEDIQRCTDVALEKTDIQFKFNNLKNKPRLNVSAFPKTIRYQDKAETTIVENEVHFKMYNNYQNFIKRGEIRIFEHGASTQSTPLKILPLERDNQTSWQVNFKPIDGAVKQLDYLLRVYDEHNNFDETKVNTLWVVNALDEQSKQKITAFNHSDLLLAYGDNQLQKQNISLEGGTVTISGAQIPAGHDVWLAGKKVPVNEKGEFVSEQLFPRGLHTIEVAVLNQTGNGELFLRDVGFSKSDWFYVGVGDVTVARDFTEGPAKLVTQDDTEYNEEISVSGRFAYYTEGRFGDNWQLVSSADTQEAPIDELFSNFLEKNPRALLRRLDPDLFYPTFGDDATLEERAPTMGKLYVKLQRKKSYGVLGNFMVGYLDTTLAQIDRGLYGLNLHYETEKYTSFGEQKFMIDGFGAEPGTVAGRDEFRGTGGSLYFLRHQDVLIGSDRIRVEVRDKNSGIVIASKNLVPVIDYDLDYIQGRILLSQPLESLAKDGLLVSTNSLSGNPVYLVSRYEYSPGFTEVDTLAYGARSHYWFGDTVKIGASYSSQKEDQKTRSVNGVDLTLRKSAGTWLRLEGASTEGDGVSTLDSIDGGFSFAQQTNVTTEDEKSNAYRVDGSISFADLMENGKGTINFYSQKRDAGYSAPGQITATESKKSGAQYSTPIGKRVKLNIKADVSKQELALDENALDVSASYQLSSQWALSGGVRADERIDNAPIVANTQKQGKRLDLALEARYSSNANWGAYGFVQGTSSTTGNREDNNRVGLGGDYKATDKFTLNGEISQGDLGTGVKLGTDYQVSQQSNIYSAYTFETIRTDSGLNSRKGSWNTGMRSRYTDTTSIYGEERYAHGDVPTGLTHVFGVDYVPNSGWNFGANIEAGVLEDKTTGAQTTRQAIGFITGYKQKAVHYAGALEYRTDETEDATTLAINKRTTWLLKNNFKYQINPSWRFLAKANLSDTTSNQGKLFDGSFNEFVLGYGYRPVDNDRLNLLAKYTYFYNIPVGGLSATSPIIGQVGGANNPIDFIQKSHIFSLDSIYDLNQQWSVGGKYAYRLGQVAQDRLNPQFFDSRASLYILRADWHITHRWDALIEARLLDLPDAQDQRSGALLGVYRHIGDNIKFGIGYNFTDFSDDLTDLDYTSHGIFINLVGKI